MSKLRDPRAVAQATECDAAAVAAVLPLVLSALEERHLLTPHVVIGVLATIATECSFKPVEEAYWLSPKKRAQYFDGTAYGKVDPQTGKRYFGRGFIQLTWKSNYEKYGPLLDVDLVHHPELALEPATAARIVAMFFSLNHVDKACAAQDWTHVRKLVNGGLNGWDTFSQCVTRLEALYAASADA